LAVEGREINFKGVKIAEIREIQWQHLHRVCNT